MIPLPEYLFVYGTLMQGYINPFAEKLHKLSTFQGNGSFPGLLYNAGWYPAAIYSEESNFSVFGEVYKLQNSADLIKELDEYEDVFEDEKSSLYVRKIISVKIEDQLFLDCWVYLYNQSVADLARIESGHFRDI